MNRERNQFLNVDEKNKVIYLSKSYHGESRISPEDAFTLLSYYGYKARPEENNRIWDVINTIEDYDALMIMGIVP